MPESTHNLSPAGRVYLAMGPIAIEPRSPQTFRRNLTVAYAIAAVVWVVAGVLLFGVMFLLIDLSLASSQPDGYASAAILVPVLAPVLIILAIWLLLRANHVPKAFLVSLLGTLLGGGGTVGLVLLILQTDLTVGAFWLPIAVLLPASYVLIGRFVFPVSPNATESRGRSALPSIQPPGAPTRPYRGKPPTRR